MKINLAHVGLAFVCGVLLSSGVLIPNVQAANQPHMRSALDDLRDARHQLEIAEQDKGGHRVRAIDFVNDAIDEVKSGIAAGD